MVEEAVGGVGRGRMKDEGRRMKEGIRGGLLVGVGEQDLFDQVFGGPVVVDQVLRQVVEEFGVGGFFSECAEVVCGGDDALSEEVVPDSVDVDSWGEGVGGVCYFCCEV